MLTVDQAAERLGVEPEQVRRLIRAGKLAARRVGRTLVLDEDAVESRARLPITAGRALAPHTAWAALWQLSGEDVAWLPPADRSRLLARLRGYDPDQLVAACRDRAERHELRVLPAYRQRLLDTDGVVPSGLTAAAAVGADIVAREAAVEVYSSQDTLDGLRGDLGVSDRGEPNLVVRVPRYDELTLTGRAHMPAAVVAVDLAESPDVRTRRAGLDLLAAALGDLPR
ncbi:helix-turn-helix domain-containing protein [Blastococcus xanthinilyticus]|uniref:Excisionase family DNA binding protein n=1 Tax=Blastococcus xanthinilyticus TaxID=1564164 RepID=A0A5S5D870_9ACTN|nr:helix-turn-helix domain-containing protein [Blastococcus xanthinilyticus]TYP90779.1 excisionase family DNA binding protein [Blastococcus xanthinilyticus]